MGCDNCTCRDDDVPHLSADPSNRELLAAVWHYALPQLSDDAE